jgi:hypothetical protein
MSSVYRWQGYGPKKGIDIKTEAIYLLMDLWAFEHEGTELDQFHFLDNTELLSVAEFMAIARCVW